MRKSLYFILLIISLLLATSCNGEGEKVEEPEEPIESIPEKDEVEEPIIEKPKIPDPKEEALEIIEDLKEKGYLQSKLNGGYIKEVDYNNRPVSVMYDNHPYARWQAGILMADIVYECEVEYPFTRYIAIFQDKEPEHIGPVRSARPYYLRYALEYDSIYVHVGGSNDARAKIKDYNMANVDGLYSGSFWRYNDTGKSIPNNMYTDIKNIREAQNLYGYRSEGEFEGYIFNDLIEPINQNFEPDVCIDLNIIFNPHYEVDFSYNEDEEIYTRFINGEKQIDEYYEEDIEATNIIVIETTKSVLDDVGRLAIDTSGQGEGTYTTKGEKVNITWEKDSYNSKTFFYYKNGQEIVLNPGQTWIEVTTQDTSINYHKE